MFNVTPCCYLWNTCPKPNDINRQTKIVLQKHFHRFSVSAKAKANTKHMEKAKRLSLGVCKRNKKRLLKKVADYLKSDSYMFAPLVKSRSHQKIHSPSVTGMEIKEPIKVKNQKLLERIVDYMKSDSYLYASLIAPQPMASSPKGHVRFVKKVSMEISKRTVTMKGNKPIIQSANVITEEKTRGGQCSRSTTFGTEGNGKEYGIFKLPHLIGIRDARFTAKQSPRGLNPWCIKHTNLGD